MTSRTEFPGTPLAPGMAILPPTAEESVRGPRAPGTAGTDRPVQDTDNISYILIIWGITFDRIELKPIK